MKIHLVRKQTIENFVAGNMGSRSSFSHWLTTIKFADWSQPADILQTFGTSDFLGKHSNRVVFDIGGNKYRMICNCFFGNKKVRLFICWIGYHAEYDHLCNRNQQ